MIARYLVIKYSDTVHNQTPETWPFRTPENTRHRVKDRVIPTIKSL